MGLQSKEFIMTNADITAIFAQIGLIVVGVLFWLAFYGVCYWIGRGIGALIYRRKGKGESKDTTPKFVNTWSAGWNDRDKYAEQDRNRLEKQVEYQRQRADRYFEEMLDAKFPSRVQRRADEDAAAKAVESPLVEPDHAQEQIDTDE